MAVIQLTEIFVSFGEKPVLADVSLGLQQGDRVGLIGANGSGKTTLLRILAGALPPDGGRVERARAARIGFMEQEPDLPESVSLRDVALSAFADSMEMEARMRALEHEIASADKAARHALLGRLGKLQEVFERSGGYDRERRADAALTGVGFAPAALMKPVSILSGGERSRAALARLLLREPDILLLDEPTNHLDLGGIEWVEEFLAKKFRGTAVIVSHDRAFLDRTVSRVWELADGAVEEYPGNYTTYAKLKNERRVAQRREYDKQQAFIRKEEEFIRRYGAGQRSKEARGRRGRLNRLERVDAPARERGVSMRFDTARTSGEVCLRVQGLAKRFGRRVLFADLDFEVYRGDRVGIVGPNGSGKTTLLKILLGEETPDGGAVDRGSDIHFGLLEQQARGLDSERSVLDEVWERKRTLDEVEVRGVLGRFRFSGDEAVGKRMRDLSGGERTRVALAGLMVERPNVLVLDEPTNHLDIGSREAFESALEDYEGTVVAVSHDRYFLNRIVEKLIVLDGTGGARVVHGNYAFFARIRARDAHQNQTTRPPGSASPKRSGEKKRSGLSKNRLAGLEKEIGELEAEKRELEANLADPDLYADAEESQRIVARYNTISRSLEERYALWLEQ